MRHALRLAFVSCSNYTGGFFTAYRGLAARDDPDAVLHLGDYVYEYGNDPREVGVPGSGDRYGPAALIGVRDHRPEVEMVTLEDYRVRHALYKTDPDQQAAHQRHPWIVIFDDHEITNDAHATGAENHEPADDPHTAYTGPQEPPGIRAEGDFLAQRATAFQAYLEWMPIREPESWQRRPHQGTQFLRRFAFGDLADLSVLDTPEPQPAGPGRRGRRRQPRPGRPRAAPARARAAGLADERADPLEAMRASTADAVVLTGDIHSSWANDLPTDPAAYRADRTSSAGVVFVCPSVTSDGFEEVLGSAAAAVATTGAFQATNPWIRFLEGIGHGFAVLDVTPERVQTDFWFIRSGGDKGLAVDPRTDPSATVAYETSYASTRGSRQVSGPVPQLGPRSDQPGTATRQGRRRGRG